MLCGPRLQGITSPRSAAGPECVTYRCRGGVRASLSVLEAGFESRGMLASNQCRGGSDWVEEAAGEAGKKLDLEVF